MATLRTSLLYFEPRSAAEAALWGAHGYAPLSTYWAQERGAELWGERGQRMAEGLTREPGRPINYRTPTNIWLFLGASSSTFFLKNNCASFADTIKRNSRTMFYLAI